MSRQLINEYRADLDQLKQVTGSRRETNLRPAFARLLRNWGKQFALVFVEEFQVRTVKGILISIDGALKFLLGASAPEQTRLPASRASLSAADAAAPPHPPTAKRQRTPPSPAGGEG